jgi:phosphatidylglycerophosphate synthase
MTNSKSEVKTTGLPYTHYINRPIADRMLRFLKIFTPNQITLAGFFIFILALINIYYSFGTNSVFLSYFLLALSHVLDSVDGKLARAKNMQSKFGEWLDHSLDGIRNILINVIFIVSLLPYIAMKGDVVVMLTFLTLVSQTSHYILSALKHHILSQRIGELLDNEKESFKSKFLRWVASPTDFGVFIMIVLLSFDPELFLFTYIGYGVYYTIVLVYTSYITVRINQ